jgi:CheY-like chemotaxis protein
MGKRILTIDDDPEVTHRLKRLLETAGYLVQEENDSTRALETARTFQPDVVLLDYQMPVVHGGDVAWQLASDVSLRNIRVIICSGISRSEIAIKLPPTRIPILEKPVDTDELLALLSAN